MGQLRVDGNIIAGPPQSTGSLFPGSHVHVPLATSQSPKLFQYGTGVLTQRLNSPSAFAPLNGVSSQGAVTQGDFLYLKTDSSVVLEITTNDGSGGTEVVELPVMGLFMMEFPPGRALEALAAKGSAMIEYLVTGQL